MMLTGRVHSNFTRRKVWHPNCAHGSYFSRTHVERGSGQKWVQSLQIHTSRARGPRWAPCSRPPPVGGPPRLATRHPTGTLLLLPGESRHPPRRGWAPPLRGGRGGRREPLPPAHPAHVATRAADDDHRTPHAATPRRSIAAGAAGQPPREAARRCPPQPPPRRSGEPLTSRTSWRRACRSGHGPWCRCAGRAPSGTSSGGGRGGRGPSSGPPGRRAA